MRQTLSAPRPVWPVTGRGLCAVVLFALLSLLHATLSPGASHLAALDLDSCLRQHGPAAGVQTRVAAPVAFLAEARAVGHHDGGTARSCEASVFGPRQAAAGLSDSFATTGVASCGQAATLPARVAGADATRLASPLMPAGSLVLRC
ncbi:hypothetical protein Q5762_30370 [Streptomyces sp. P9(2023)]|uniref:hypothetical protein n=1 Tax=Streptomyces sp. P9(2023) TaxID=3064394 RepID=UPI0028F4263F|nr:hypothetical protein [Streptomyces sp. P9(2023)]MDT9692560.1 hypothetical protein [Streptomyces sp. P9(2023)]